MKLHESDSTSNYPGETDLANVAGPSSVGLKGVMNGHSKQSPLVAFSSSTTVSKVPLTGEMLHDDSSINREEFVRLLIQSLRDVGYIESAATLEAESGYTMEAPQVAEFRQFVLDGRWEDAEMSLSTLGVSDPDDLTAAKFLISQQKYLELLESRNVTGALYVLRNELAPLNIDMERLHTLSSYMMCSTTEDLLSRARWDGANGASRRRLLIDIQKYIPSAVMIPPHRFETLIEQARAYQRQSCLYHNSRSIFSLYSDHECTRADFPTLTTHILAHHEDEVWHIQWSHDGRYLASASKDKTAIIWKIGPLVGPAERECSMEKVLRDHPYPVNCIAWSPDDKLLLTTSDSVIKVWNVKTGVCTRELTEGHNDTVMALVWLPDNSGFVSGGMDRKIVIWDVDGTKRDSWGPISVRIEDLAVTPDQTRVVAVGLIRTSTPLSASSPHHDGPLATPSTAPANVTHIDHRMVIFDLIGKREEISIKLEGELTSIKTSSDSRYALINHAPDELQMWDLETARMTRKFTGQRQGKHIIRSCFGGAANNFIVSGSEDGYVYVWHRDTGVLLEILKGHGRGSVNSVAWHPHEERVFASCSDDGTIRIWEPPLPEIDATPLEPTWATIPDKGKSNQPQIPSQTQEMPISVATTA